MDNYNKICNFGNRITLS